MSRSSVGGTLTVDALARLHFNALSHAEQAQAIVRMADAGQTDDTIARATALSVEQVRRVVTDSASGKWVAGKWYPDWRIRELAEKHATAVLDVDDQ
jgi:hypothetical protein